VVVPDWGENVENVFQVNSPDPAIALIPFLLVLFVVWALVFFVLIVAFRRWCRAA
jgi:hypothetical protein